MNNIKINNNNNNGCSSIGTKNIEKKLIEKKPKISQIHQYQSKSALTPINIKSSHSDTPSNSYNSHNSHRSSKKESFNLKKRSSISQNFPLNKKYSSSNFKNCLSNSSNNFTNYPTPYVNYCNTSNTSTNYQTPDVNYCNTYTDPYSLYYPCFYDYQPHQYDYTGYYDNGYYPPQTPVQDTVPKQEDTQKKELKDLKKRVEELQNPPKQPKTSQESSKKLEVLYKNLLHQNSNNQDYLNLHSSLLPPKPSFSIKDINLFKSNLLDISSSLLELLKPPETPFQPKPLKERNMQKLLNNNINNSFLFSPDYSPFSLDPTFYSPSNSPSFYPPISPIDISSCLLPSQQLWGQMPQLQPNFAQSLALQPDLSHLSALPPDLNQASLLDSLAQLSLQQSNNINNGCSISLDQQIKNILEQYNKNVLQTKSNPQDFVIRDYLHSLADLEVPSTQKLLDSNSSFFQQENPQHKFSNISQQTHPALRSQLQQTLLQDLQQPLLQQKFQNQLKELHRNNKLLQQQLNNSTQLNNIAQLTNPEITAPLLAQISNEKAQQELLETKRFIDNSKKLNNSTKFNNSTHSLSSTNFHSFSDLNSPTQQIPQHTISPLLQQIKVLQAQQDSLGMKLIMKQQLDLEELKDKLDSHLKKFNQSDTDLEKMEEENETEVDDNEDDKEEEEDEEKAKNDIWCCPVYLQKAKKNSDKNGQNLSGDIYNLNKSNFETAKNNSSSLRKSRSSIRNPFKSFFSSGGQFGRIKEAKKQNLKFYNLIPRKSMPHESMKVGIDRGLQLLRSKTKKTEKPSKNDDRIMVLMPAEGF